MMSRLCPKCQRVMSYDSYFKANVCRQCGTMEEVSFIEITSKKIISSKIKASKKRMIIVK